MLNFIIFAYNKIVKLWLGAKDILIKQFVYHVMESQISKHLKILYGN